MSNEKGIDPKKLNAMKMKILKAEQENLRTKDKTTDQMVDHIRKIIISALKEGISHSCVGLMLVVFSSSVSGWLSS